MWRVLLDRCGGVPLPAVAFSCLFFSLSLSSFFLLSDLLHFFFCALSLSLFLFSSPLSLTFFSLSSFFFFSLSLSFFCLFSTNEPAKQNEKKGTGRKSARKVLRCECVCMSVSVQYK
eukprot:TRINITY_DN16_c0_g3_i2.p2 TRINITY_DN16_c0_g3~~TRINITY_DN16_c0_g3_i2.p2  ORF type:complete len:117 (-),score=7.22 TRINITY_DN16_c0_g3_i2:111-461(-)